MNKTIIIEGPNNQGKSTLANNIKQKFPIYDFQYIKTNQPKTDNTYKEYTDQILNIMYKDENTIMDRFHLGEMVYPIIKNRKLMSLDDYLKLECLLKQTCGDVLLIMPITNVKLTLKINKINKEEYIKPKEVKQEFELFNNIFEKSLLSKIKYDYTNEGDFWQILKYYINGV